MRVVKQDRLLGDVTLRCGEPYNFFWRGHRPKPLFYDEPFFSSIQSAITKIIQTIASCVFDQLTVGTAEPLPGEPDGRLSVKLADLNV
jgi:hypothetical protein